jgi:RsiW-degrading membrane proteinase PrsW (M82 family)
MLLATVLLYLSLGGCSILAIALVMQYDLHRREPWHCMILAIVAGGLAMYGCMKGQELLALRWDVFHNTDAVVRWAILAGTTEELTKLLVVVMMALVFRRHFDEPIDGLIYGAMAGLGAALTESIQMQGIPHQLTTLPREEPIRLMGHLVMGGIGGFGVGLVRFISWKYIPVAMACLISAVSVHVMWDVIAYKLGDLRDTGGAITYRHTGVSIAIMLGGFLHFRLLVKVAPHRRTIPIQAISQPAMVPVVQTAADRPTDSR